MGLFDEVGEVKELGLDKMPLVDLFKVGVKSLEDFEKNPSAATYEEMEKTLNMILKRFDEFPNDVKGKVAGVPSVISMSLPALKQLPSLGPTGAAAIPTLTMSIKTSLNFAISYL